MAKIQIKNEKTIILEKKSQKRVILFIYHTNRAFTLHKIKYREGAPSHRTFPISSPSNTSLIFLCLLQLLIEALGHGIIMIGILQPLRKMAVVVLLGFQLSERLNHTLLFQHSETSGSCG